MTRQTMHGGLFDGQVVDVDDHCQVVSFPTIKAGDSIGRSFAEIMHEFHFDPETGDIVEPDDIRKVMTAGKVDYRRTADGFVAED